MTTPTTLPPVPPAVPRQREAQAGPVIVDVTRDSLPPELVAPRRRPAEIVPALRPIAVAAYRTRRWLNWQVSRAPFALTRSSEDLPFLAAEHASPLLRALGASQMWLQHNKVINLRLASARMDGVLIKPGEVLSFCRLVGSTTAAKGYVEGMMLEGGETVPGIGGGICQIANAMHWLSLHSPLTVVERSTHSEDPFPDDGRTIPWGTGCTIFHNYVDLQLRNDTDSTYQFRIRVGEQHLEVELRANAAARCAYRVYARDEHYRHCEGRYYRSNELWREKIDPDGTVTSELVKANLARTLYDPRPTDAAVEQR